MAQVEVDMPGGLDITETAPRRDKALIQLNWTDITIKAMPPTGRCAT